LESGFLAILHQMEEEKGINVNVLISTLEEALSVAYRKHYGNHEKISVIVDSETGEIKVIADKVVVDNLENENLEISLEEANYKVDDIVPCEVKKESFGRIAAQTARQVISQKLREAEREMVYDIFSDSIGKIITAKVTGLEIGNGGIALEINGFEVILPITTQSPIEKFEISQKIKVYVEDVVPNSRGPFVKVSRKSPELVRCLFELEVPEIRNGTVVINNVIREAGVKTKVAVSTTNPNVDPIGACIGIKGTRIRKVVEEIQGEKIDVIKYSDDLDEYIRSALSPANVSEVILNENHECQIKVPSKELSLAIGKRGINARIAARLTGYRIDIKPDEEEF
jgi:transcription termination/antitermination protein NusA